MTIPVSFGHLQVILPQQIVQLPDHRKGKNTYYSSKDAAAGALGRIGILKHISLGV